MIKVLARMIVDGFGEEVMKTVDVRGAGCCNNIWRW